jgi:hypothetical protein
MGGCSRCYGPKPRARPIETEFVAVGVNEVEEALTPFGIAGHSSWLVSRSERTVVKCVNIGNIRDYPREAASQHWLPDRGARMENGGAPDHPPAPIEVPQSGSSKLTH